MSSKSDYLKRYLSRDSEKQRKKDKYGKKRTNLAIHDDDVDWRSIAPSHKEENDVDEDDPDTAPVVAAVQDESVRKWLPVLKAETFEQADSKNSGSVSLVHMSDGAPDLSPVRKHVYLHTPNDKADNAHCVSSAPDLSPPRCSFEAQDFSPPREAKKHRMRRPLSPDIIAHGDIASSRPRRNDSVSPMRETRHDSVSPLREIRRDSVSSMRETRHDSVSPMRETRHDSLSPPRETRHDSANIFSPETHSASINSMDTAPSGFVPKIHASRKDLSQDKITEFDYGRHVETVYRDKFGKKIDPRLERIREKEERRKKDEIEEQFMEWGRGVTQTKSTHEKVTDEIYEMSKPLARYVDDEDLEKMLKDREREGDPMLAFIKRKTEATHKSSGRVTKMKPSYKGSFPPNRFSIKPGYRWDGVNRSNGFEKTWFHQQSNQKAVADEAYKWSVEDM